jgi:ubiquinol-cytochrome c reductase cytochrome b subunit
MFAFSQGMVLLRENKIFYFDPFSMVRSFSSFHSLKEESNNSSHSNSHSNLDSHSNMNENSNVNSYPNPEANCLPDQNKIRLLSSKRIGPHNIDIISIIVGSTLGDTHLEKRQNKNGAGTRIIFEQSNKNVEYLMWFHSYLSHRGYCNEKKPILHKRIRKNGEVFFHYRINSYTFSSLNWIHNMFYIFNDINNKDIKIIPSNIEEYLTPLALAIWFMDDGSKLGKGAKIATNCFTEKEVLFLCEVLHKKYNITATKHSGGKKIGHVLYIHKNSMIIFAKLIKQYMLPSLFYKLGDY